MVIEPKNELAAFFLETNDKIDRCADILTKRFINTRQCMDRMNEIMKLCKLVMMEMKEYDV